MATIIAKVAGIIGKNVLSANLRRPEPTPEPTPRQKAPGYRQKAGVYEQKAAGFGQKAAGFEIIGIEKLENIWFFVHLFVPLQTEN